MGISDTQLVNIEILKLSSFEYLKCPLCQCLAFPPCRPNCSSADHIFCKQCIDTWMKASPTCPVCKVPVHQVGEDLLLRKMLDDLMIKCNNFKQSCTWTGKHADLKDHLLQCVFEIIPCENEGCLERIMRGKLVEHLKVCEWRIVECNLCKKRVTFKNLKNHYEECPEYIVKKCSKCNQDLKRKELDTHEQECILQEVSCSVCHKRIPRKEMEKHVQENMLHHFLALSKKIQALESLVETHKNMFKYFQNNITLGHTAFITAIIELSDGSIASASEDKSVKIWSRYGNCIRTFAGLPGPPTMLRELKDGTIVASADNFIKICKRNGATRRFYSADMQYSKTFTDLRDGCIAFLRDSAIEIWNTEGKCLQILRDTKRPIITMIKELRDGSIAGCCCLPERNNQKGIDNAVTIWRRDGTIFQTLSFSDKARYSNMFELRDGTIMLKSENSLDIKLRKGGIQSIKDAADPIIELRDGSIAARSKSGTDIKIWNRIGVCEQVLEGVNTVYELKDGCIASRSYGGRSIKIWNRKEKKPQCIQVIEPKLFSFISFVMELRDGSLVCREERKTGISDSAIMIWRRDGTLVHTFRNIRPPILELQDGCIAGISTVGDHVIKVWNRKGICVQTLSGALTVK